MGSDTLALPATNGSQGNPVFRPQFPPVLDAYVMTWNSPPVDRPTWTFDTSLQTAGSSLVWGKSGGGTWDTGTNWDRPSLYWRPQLPGGGPAIDCIDVQLHGGHRRADQAATA